MTTSVTIPKTAGVNPLKGLLEYGQSPWMDYIRRDLLTGGGLKQMINDDGLRGMTSNPAIFEKSIVGSTLYSDILTSAEAKTLDAKGLYEKIAIRDVQDACDIFKPVYQQTHRRDGYVSLEVSPYLANDTKGTLEEARRLWKTVGRENLMIKVPGTPEGLPAIRQLLEDGLNINITLLFAQSAYEQVAEAFLAALEARALKGLDISHSASVASFFVSRIDTLVDSEAGRNRKEGDRAYQGTSGEPVRQNRDRQRQAYVQEIPRTVRRCALEGACGQGRPDAALALGQHQYEECEVSRRSVRRGTDRRGYRRHDSTGDFRRFPGARQTARKLDRGRSRCGQTHGRPRKGGHFHEGSDRQTPGRWREAFRRRFQDVARSHGEVCGQSLSRYKL